MSSFSLITSYILFFNILIVFAQPPPSQSGVNLPPQQHQQTLTVHKPPPPQTHHQQQQQPQSNSNNDAVRIKSSENGNNNQNQQAGGPGAGHFSNSYRNGPNNSGRDQLPGQYINTQQGFTTYTAYPQELQAYTTTAAAVPQSPQLFGLSSTGDFQLSAYFGPVFWVSLCVIVIIVIIIMYYRSSGGFDRLGGFVEDLQKPTKDGGRAIDLDKLTAMAYTAFDQYGKWKNASYKKS